MVGRSQAPIVEVLGVTKHYAGVQALGDAALDILPAEVLGLVGENGAGKSTLIKILGGAVRRDSGIVRVDGTDVEIADERAASRLGIRVIPQDLALVDRLSVAENLLLGQSVGSRAGIVSRSKQREAARQMLEGFIDVDPARRISQLSLAQRWMVAIAKACSGSPRVVIMDEPTVALSDSEVHIVFDVISNMSKRGIATVFVSHRLEEVLAICDRVAVMKDGVSVGTHSVAALDHGKLMALIVGEKVAASFEALEHELPPEPGPVALSVRGLTGGPLRSVDIDVHAGEILGIGGLVGSGRSSLLGQIFGVHRPDSGTVELDGRVIHVNTPTDAIKHGIALIPEDRRAQALLLLRTVRENMVLTHLRLFRRAPRLPLPNRARETEATRSSIDKLGVKTSGVGQRTAHLSGGNQQKVVIARSLMANDLKVLMLDEPTKGVDIGARMEIFDIVRGLAASGVAVLVVSSDLEELAAVSHRTVVLREGRVSGELSSPLDAHDILDLCFLNASGVRQEVPLA